MYSAQEKPENEKKNSFQKARKNDPFTEQMCLLRKVSSPTHFNFRKYKYTMSKYIWHMRKSQWECVVYVCFLYTPQWSLEPMCCVMSVEFRMQKYDCALVIQKDFSDML